jgi:hypothetical protein
VVLCLSGIFSLLLLGQLGVKRFPLGKMGLVFAVPVQVGQQEAAAKPNSNVGDNLSSQGAYDRSNSHDGMQ